jgi:malonyl-CoA O-methyltransferase
MKGLDVPRVARAFARAASTYDAAARLQAAVREELLSRLDHFGLEPRVVIDAGCGTGAATLALAERYRDAVTVGVDIALPMLLRAGERLPPRTWRVRFRPSVPTFGRLCADAHRLPLADGCAQLVFSSLMLQWSPDPDACLRELRRVLAPGGLLCLATFGPATLQELRRSWEEADRASGVVHEHVSAFADMHDLGSALTRAGFAEPVLDVDTHATTYPDLRSLMRELQAIGARNATDGRPRALTGRARLQRLERAYERWRLADGSLPATWEVIHVAAFAAAAVGPRSDGPPRPDEVAVPLSRLGRRERPPG